MNDYTILSARMALFGGLTPRQKEIAYLIGQGLRDKEVAQVACIQPQTVKNHMTEIGKELRLTRRNELVYLMAYWAGYNDATAKQRVKIVTHPVEVVA